MFIHQANIIKRNVEINKNKGYNKNLNAYIDQFFQFLLLYCKIVANTKFI